MIDRDRVMAESVEDLDFTGEWAVTDKSETFFHGCRDSVFMFTMHRAKSQHTTERKKE